MPFTFKKLSNTFLQSLILVSILGLILSEIFFAETFGVKYTTAINATILISLSIIFTPFVDIARSKKAPPNALIFAAFLSVLGGYVLTNNKEFSFNLGDIFIIIAGTLRTAMLSATKVFTNRFKFNSLVLTYIQMGFIFVVSFIVLLFLQESINLKIGTKF